MNSVSVSSLKLALSRVRSLPYVKVGLRLLCSAAWVTWTSWGRRDPTAGLSFGCCMARERCLQCRTEQGPMGSAGRSRSLSLGIAVSIPGNAVSAW